MSPSCLSCRRRPEEEGRRLRSESAGWRSFLARIRYRMRRTINLGISTFRASTHICASGIAPPLRKQASLFVLATGTQCARRAQLDPRPLVTYLKASRYTACQGRMETRRAAAVVGGTAGTESASAPAPAPSRRVTLQVGGSGERSNGTKCGGNKDDDGDDDVPSVALAALHVTGTE